MRVSYLAAVPDDAVWKLGISETIRRARLFSEEGAPEDLHMMPGSLIRVVCVDGVDFIAVNPRGINEDCFLLYRRAE